jgi:hypothetical protein
MASTIKVNNIQNQCGANIANKCGTTITLGASGDTITLACGASQTGFGRTGTVDWDTTAKTAGFTAVSGNGYFVNTTSGAVTVTLPAGSAGDIVAISDYASTAQTNNITITPNGTNKINGVNLPYYISTQGLAVTLVYVDDTKGWKSVTGSDADATGTSPSYIAATGGTITCCGDYKIHTFTGPGTFTVTCAGNAAGSNSVDYLVIAGGGSGGTADRAGGGAGGGYRFSNGTASGCYSAGPAPLGASALPVSATAFPITVGGGGAGVGGPNNRGNQGSNSIFSTITSTGGGWGGSGSRTYGCGAMDGGDGGSGGGSGGTGDCNPADPLGGVKGTGNSPSVSPPQGNPGGTGNHFPGEWAGGGGGGGAGAAGGDASPKSTPAATPAIAGAGGDGLTSCITASPVTRTGGGGATGANIPASLGGSGGGGGGCNSGTGGGGGTNTGSGGGAGPNPAGSGAGGSGIVIIRYKYQ